MNFNQSLTRAYSKLKKERDQQYKEECRSQIELRRYCNSRRSTLLSLSDRTSQSALKVAKLIQTSRFGYSINSIIEPTKLNESLDVTVLANTKKYTSYSSTISPSRRPLDITANSNNVSLGYLSPGINISTQVGFNSKGSNGLFTPIVKGYKLSNSMRYKTPNCTLQYKRATPTKDSTNSLQCHNESDVAHIDH